MERYADTDADSGIHSFENGDDWIRVRFLHGGTYRYSYASAGRGNVERMKELAVQGDGLNAFITAVVRRRYAERESKLPNRCVSQWPADALAKVSRSSN